MLNALACFFHTVISQIVFSNACYAHSNSLQWTLLHTLRHHHMAVPRGGKPKHLANPPPLLQSHLISAKPDIETCTTLAPQGGKTQISAGLLFFLCVPWGCPDLNKVYFINDQWDLISCLHSPFPVAVVTHSLRLCTFIPSQGKAVWGNLHPHWVDETGEWNRILSKIMRWGTWEKSWGEIFIPQLHDKA